MAYGITEQGFLRKPLDVIKQELEQGLQGEFGADLQIDPTSPEGQFIGVMTGALDELWQLGALAYTVLSPDDASGAALDNVSSLNYIQRQDAVASTTTLLFTSVSGVSIPAGTTFSNEDTAASSEDVFEFTLDANVTVPAGSIDYAIGTQATCTVTGPVDAVAGSITTIVDLTSGLDSVSNTNTVIGNDVETDPQFRARRQASVARAGANQIDNIRSAVLSVTSVTSCNVVSTPYATGDEGQPKYSIRVIVEGGDDTEIAEAIFSKIPTGIPTWSNGGTVIPITDSQGTVHSIEFDRPTLVPIFVSIEGSILPTDTGYTADGLKQAIVDWGNQNINSGDDVYAGQLYTPANTVGSLAITSILVGTTASPSDTQVGILLSQKASWDLANVDVTGVLG